MSYHAAFQSQKFKTHIIIIFVHRYESHPFWCTGFTFWSLPSEAPDLFIDLAASDLVIFKGDLNHRKVSQTLNHS